MQPIISIIVPIYKAEKYLYRCIDSILAQTFTDFELILVDDGSPDGSGVICDEYAKKDKRIKVIHKENGGVASARQYGINNAIGIYTIHADPDDWIDSKMLEELYNKVIEENADIVICDFFWIESNNKCILYKQAPSNLDAHKLISDLMYEKQFGSLCNKLIKRSCYINNNISFTYNINICEDLLICIKILKTNPKVVYLNKAFYYYDQYSNSNSITRCFDRNKYKMFQNLLSEFELLLKEEYIKEIYYRKANLALLSMSHCIFTSKEYKNIYKKECKQLLPYIKRLRSKVEFIISAYGYQNIITYFSPKITKLSKLIRNLFNYRYNL